MSPLAKLTHVRTVPLLLGLLGCGTAVAASTVSEQPAEQTLSIKPQGRYCGLYCLYTVLKWIDKPVRFESLLRPDYVSSADGSTIAELQTAARDHGLSAVAAANLTSASLAACPHPVILHVKKDEGSSKYDHYVLFVGAKDGLLQLYDPPQPPRPISFAELAPRWDGTGLLLSDGPIDVDAVFAPARWRFTGAAAGLLVLIGLGGLARRRWPAACPSHAKKHRFAAAAVQCALLVACTAGAAMAYHAASSDGLLANTAGTRFIQYTQFGSLLPTIDASDIEGLTAADNVVFVDARYPQDFKLDHLPGAINVPVSSPREMRVAAMQDVSRGTRIIVYCQSRQCTFAGKVASRLATDGFTNIAIFRGGWREWADSQRGKRTNGTR